MGRPGNRKFDCDETVIHEAQKHGISLEEISETKILSVAKIEKKLKKEHPLFWAKVEPFVQRPNGKISVAPSTDARPTVNEAITFEPLDDSEFVDALIGMSADKKLDNSSK